MAKKEESLEWKVASLVREYGIIKTRDAELS